ncbi:MAG: ACP S-malonyltransferase [Puniceicoccales bacterium]|jgi:[acyl-carrier-protein] S-malonyltransferase|nr:ACP S-malonyltransferase [Puniceicoccales bacterium]
MKIGLIFPGQGAQCVGMGKSLYDGNRAASLVFKLAEKVIGESFLNTLFCGPECNLTATSCCQPALFTHSYAAAEVMRDLYPEKQAEITFGLSLGEISALCISGVFDFETGLKITHMRGSLMQKACENTHGTMVSLIGGMFDDILEICDKTGVEIANVNCPGQVVISGECGAMQSAIAMAEKMPFKRIFPLKVAGAYHSQLMAEACVGFEKFVNDIKFEDPKIGVISNVTADFMKTGEDAKRLLVKQIVSPVLFAKCCERAICCGVKIFFECGTGKILSGLMKRVNPDVAVTSLDNISDFNL